MRLGRWPLGHGHRHQPVRRRRHLPRRTERDRGRWRRRRTSWRRGSKCGKEIWVKELSGKRVGAVGRGRDGDHLAVVGLRRRAEAWHGAWQQVAPFVGQGENLDVGDLDPGKLVSVELARQSVSLVTNIILLTHLLRTGHQGHRGHAGRVRP